MDATTLNAQVYFGLRKIGLPKLRNCAISRDLVAAKTPLPLAGGEHRGARDVRRAAARHHVRPGLVFYSGDLVVGGGWIAEAVRALIAPIFSYGIKTKAVPRHCNGS
jgi:hypothetical protein